MQTYKKIFVKIFLSYFTIYLIMMGIFTYIKVVDVKREYRSYVYSVLHGLESDVKRIMDSDISKEEKITDLNTTLTRRLQFSDAYQVYGVAAVEKDKEYIAQSGYYMENRGMNMYFDKLPDGEKYIDLEKLFSDEELVTFLEPFEQMTWSSVKLRGEKKEEMEVLHRIKVEGYSRGAEVIPTTMRHYTIQKRGHAWHAEDEVLKATYHFKEEQQQDMKPYESDYWHFVNVTDVRDLDKYPLDLNRVERIQKLREQMYAMNFKRGYNWDESFLKMNYSYHNNVVTEEEGYDLTFIMAYEPLKVTIGDLKIVYIFSLSIVLCMSLLLARGMWKANKKQEALEKSRRDLIDAVAHELKTPLAIIKAYGESIKEKIDEGKKDAYIDVIIDETNTMNELILEMLYLSKLENNALLFQFEVVHIEAIVDQVLDKYALLLKEKEIEVTVEKLANKEVRADAKAMERVISNLIINAIEHTYPKGKIFITIEKSGIAIENEGEHIPEEEFTTIWDVFKKSSDIHNRGHEGSGVGLSIVKKLLEAHDMTYGVLNTNKGIKFWFKL